MSYNKKERILHELSLGKNVNDISNELGFNRSYIYKIKRENDPVPQQSLINISNILKKSNLNEFIVNGLRIECSDEILSKIIRGFKND